MKKLLMAGVALVASAMAAQAASLADARGKIADVIENPNKMTETIQTLEAADQKAFLAEVNGAIESLPGTEAEKNAKYLDVNRAAIKGAKKGNLADLLGVTYATAGLESLALINESFASDLFNRAANAQQSFTDDQFTTIATNTMAKIEAATADADSAAVRNGFAILMFIRASNGTPATLRQTLVDQMPQENMRKTALEDWFPAALAEGQDKTYEPMLGGEPEVDVAIIVPTTEGLNALLIDLSNGVTDKKTGLPSLAFSNIATDPSRANFSVTDQDEELNRHPRFYMESDPYFGQRISTTPSRR